MNYEKYILENFKYDNGNLINLDNTKGLKKKYAFKSQKKTYRFYSLKEALKNKKEMENLL